MLYRQLKPPAHLRDYVRFFWFMESTKTKGRDIEEHMMLATNNQMRYQLIIAFLTRQAQGKCRPKEVPAVEAIKSIIRQRGVASVKELANQSYLSVRQFERKFKQYAGFSPKLYTRIVRFQSAMKNYGQPGQSLTEIAHRSGYYDQSHFIHEFKGFSGYHPKTFFSGKAEGVEYREEIRKD